MFTHPKSTVRAILDNPTLRSQISLEQIKISRYRQAENGVINYNPFRVRQKEIGERWSTSKKFKQLVFTHPKINTSHGAQANAIAFAGGVARSEILTPQIVSPV